MITLFAAVPVWVVDLGVTDGGFLSGGDTLQWEWGTPSSGPVTYGALWGTNLEGPYLHDTTDWLQITLPDLSGVETPSLLLDHWYAVRSGDSALLQIDAGSGFTSAIPAGGYPSEGGFVGESLTFVEDTWDLSGLDGSPTVRLVLSADASSADDGWFVRTLSIWDGDIVTPTLSAISMPSDTQDLDGPYFVEVQAVDDRTISTIDLWIDDGTGAVSIPMSATGLDIYRAEIPQVPLGGSLSYWIEASDGENTARLPSSGAQLFRVFLAAPSDLAAILPEGRGVASSVALTWEPPDSPHPVLEYEIYRELLPDPVAIVSAPPATVDLSGGEPLEFYVVARYSDADGARGDPSETLSLDIEVPELHLEPEVAYQGDELYLRITGSSLYLLQSEATLDLGSDVEVISLDVRDVSAMTALVRISEDAQTGPTSAVIGTSVGELSFPDRFTVRSGSEAPRIDRITPPSLRQGETRFVEIESTVPFAAIPSVATDDDLIVTSTLSVEGDILRFDLAAAPRAHVGPHTLSIDDGERLYTVEIEVEEYKAQVKDGCAHTPPARGWVALAALSLLSARRRGDQGGVASARTAPSSSRSS